MRRIIGLTAVLIGFCTTTPSQAAVINSADVNGFTTFQDTNTGLIWLDLNNFFDMSYLDMQAAAEGAGFTVANRAQVQGLLDSLPLAGEWPGYASIMGSAPNRELIWGAYEPEAASVSWAFSFNGDPSWSFDPATGYGLGEVLNGGGAFADMNIWAFQVAAVPEPITLATFGLMGVAGAGYVRRRMKAAPAA